MSMDMSRQEKLLLLDLILQDIRGNWGWNLEERVDMALMLASELQATPFVDSILEYTDRWDIYDDNDGRFFRMGYEFGGYIGLESQHGLSYTIMDKSKEFQYRAECLTYPDSLFEDWDKYRNM